MAVRDEKLAERNRASGGMAIDVSGCSCLRPVDSALERAARSANLPRCAGGFCRSEIIWRMDRLSRAHVRTRCSTIRKKPRCGRSRMLREGVVRSVEGKDVAVHAETICLHGDSVRARCSSRAVFGRALRRMAFPIQAPERTRSVCLSKSTPGRARRCRAERATRESIIRLDGVSDPARSIQPSSSTRRGR